MIDRTRTWLFTPIAVASVLAAAPPIAEILKGYPDAIICRAGDSRVVAYLASVKDDGSAIYRPPLAEFYITVTPDHILHHQGTDDCNGKSIDQLEKNGQAHTFTEGH